MNRLALTVAALFLIIAATAVNAQVYEWKDEKGKTNFSDKPPIGASRTQRIIESETTAASSPIQKTAADRELEFRKRQKEAQESAEKTKKEQAASAEMKEACDNSRRRLAALESGERVGLRDDKGERYFMDDAQREQEIAKARQLIESTCKQQ
ncbi:DUF4124 domain-containing protein [Propionivibrio sp.]|uniref:DUF4124 domain-containing protein n=1 Tax=Propionivibrio sp. TaxID=2212460 RepID=UPI002609BF6D|nr:DUF4124 domain-containing protein [Propionivibrio sp.]